LRPSPTTGRGEFDTISNMKKTTPARFLFGVLIVLGICAGYYYRETRSPEAIFNTAWGSINTARVDTDFIEYFRRYRELHGLLQQGEFKDTNVTPTSSFTEYLTNGQRVGGKIMEYYENRIKKLKRLNPAKDAKPLVDAAIDFYGFMDDIVKHDFLRVAEMIDTGVSDEDINDHLLELIIEKDAEMTEKYNALFDLITAYGDRHGIKYSVG